MEPQIETRMHAYTEIRKHTDANTERHTNHTHIQAHTHPLTHIFRHTLTHNDTQHSASSLCDESSQGQEERLKGPGGPVAGSELGLESVNLGLAEE